MPIEEKYIVIICLIILIVFIFKFLTSITPTDSSVFYTLFIPMLLIIGYLMISKFESYRTISGTLSVFNYLTGDTLFLRIIEDGKIFVWDDYVEELSVTEYSWDGKHDYRIIAANDPDFSNPLTTVYLDKTYSVTGKSNILIIINENGSFYEQLNKI